jgi:hypothetical protein
VSPWLAHGCRSFSRADITLNGASGIFEHVKGVQVLGLGAPGNAILLMSIAEYGVPGLWIWGLMLLAALLRCAIRGARWGTLTHAALIGAVLMVVDALLVVRVVIAVQEVAAQPHLESKVLGALLAALLLPLALELLVVATNGGSRRVRKLLSAGYLLPWSPRGFGGRLGSWPVWLSVMLLLALPALHLALVFVGVREQIAGVRVTAILVPAYVVLLAVLAASSAAPTPWTRTQRHVGLMLVFCMGLVLLAFVVARDVGAVITLTGAFVALSLMVTVARPVRGQRMGFLRAASSNGGVLALGIVLTGGLLLYAGQGGFANASLLRQHPALPSLALLSIFIGAIALLRWRQKTAWLFAAPGALVVLVLVGLSTSRFDRNPVDCSVGSVEEVASCLDAQSMDTNRLRLSYLIYPTLTRLNLTGEARGMNAVFDELHWLTHDFVGEGLMSVPPRMGLDQHDNAIATHVIGPQGRAGGLLLCVALAVPLVFLVMERRHRHRGLGRPLPWLAYGCFAFTSIYMILGNLMLVPFTGRNVYLTNAFSGTDLMEGGLLVLLTLVPLATQRETQTRAPDAIA